MATNKLPQKQNNDKAALTSLYEDFSLTKPATEEEFDNAIDMLTQYLLFGTRWEGVMAKDRKARRKIPIINDVPLICKSKDCPYAQRCPVLKQMKDSEKMKLIGTECRADKLYAVEQFAALVKELQINPDQTSDLLSVTAMIRHLIILRRIEWRLSIDDIMVKEPGMIDQRSGQVYWKEVSHPLMKEQERLENQVRKLRTELQASRKDRVAVAMSMGKGNEVLKSLFSATFEAPIDAEFSDEVEE